MDGLRSLAHLAVATSTVLSVYAELLRSLPLLGPERAAVAQLRVFVLHVLVLPDVGRSACRGANHVERRVASPLRASEQVVVDVDDEFARVSDEESAGMERRNDDYPSLRIARSSW